MNAEELRTLYALIKERYQLLALVPSLGTVKSSLKNAEELTETGPTSANSAIGIYMAKIYYGRNIQSQNIIVR